MKVLVTHPYKLVGDAIAKSVGSLYDNYEFQVCGTDSVTDSIRSFMPDVVVMSSSYAQETARELIQEIKSINDATAVVMISSATSPEELMYVLQAGIAGYLTLECSIEQLGDAISKAAAGEVALYGVDRKTLSQPTETASTNTTAQSTAIGTLTPREREVLALLSQGFSNRQIAEGLFLSEHTVRTHVQNLRSKLNVRSKFQAAVLAMQVNGAPGPATNGSFRF